MYYSIARTLPPRTLQLKMGLHHQRAMQLRTALASAVATFNAEDAKFRAVNKDLSDEYKRVSDQFKDLQRKQRHFEQIDQAKYAEIWALNEDQVMKLVKKVLTADKILYEQVLCRPWDCPIRGPDGRVVTDIDSMTSADIFHSVADTERGQARHGFGAIFIFEWDCFFFRFCARFRYSLLVTPLCLTCIMI